jgi:hypothetical protein
MRKRMNATSCTAFCSASGGVREWTVTELDMQMYTVTSKRCRRAVNSELDMLIIIYGSAIHLAH